jgi:predicted ferric reductase
MSRIVRRTKAGRIYTVSIWSVLVAAVIGPVAIAATSPLLAARPGVYVMAGLAGIAALALLLAQPLLAARYLPGLQVMQARLWHRCVGTAIVIGVALHVGGLYLTSPPDTLDALFLVAPTPFSIYGVIALWGIALTIVLVVLRSQTWFGYHIWRIVHNALAAIVVVTSIVHALMIEGTMGSLSKQFLCLCVLTATAIVIAHLRVIKPILRNR